jgi:glucose/mannose-6-phosphate isomerase
MAHDFEKLKNLRASLDPKGMIDLVQSFPVHMEDAWQRGGKFAQSDLKPTKVGKIVVCGMGGSAIGGDMVGSCLGDRLAVPLHVNRHYDVAASLREDALFVFSSYSGNTGETLASYEAVRRSGTPAVAITSGGNLEQLCREDGIPVCCIPGGLPPRSAIAYSFFPLLQTLSAMGLTTLDESEFEHARTTLTELCRAYASAGSENTAADLAFRLNGTLPFVYSCGGLFEAVARRWSCQFNENGKTLAHFATFTELNHNEIVGWKALETIRKLIVPVSLEDEDDHPMAKKQADVALGVIEPHSAGVMRVASIPGPRMTRILSAMILGDFISVYLGYLNGADPTPVENIDYLKKQLEA